jgi:hypothetical protein
MKTLVRNWLFARGFIVTKQTEAAAVLGLIRKLRPVNCGKDLVRVGVHGDGSYLVPDDLAGIDFCFSPGVSTTSRFEEHLADLNIRTFLADYSVDSPPVSRPEFTFDKKFLGSIDSDRFFTLATWKDKYLRNYSGDLILQMDIEGSEYEVILSTPEKLLNQFRIIVAEFHFLDKLLEPFAFGIMSSCFDRLLKYFHVVHIHPNNYSGIVSKGDTKIPRVMEFTFLNRSRVTHTEPQREFPHKLDEDNLPGGAPLPLPRCWYT